MLVIWYKLRLDCFSTCGSIGVDETCSQSVVVFILSEQLSHRVKHFRKENWQNLIVGALFCYLKEVVSAALVLFFQKIVNATPVSLPLLLLTPVPLSLPVLEGLDLGETAARTDSSFICLYGWRGASQNSSAQPAVTLEPGQRRGPEENRRASSRAASRLCLCTRGCMTFSNHVWTYAC